MLSKRYWPRYMGIDFIFAGAFGIAGYLVLAVGIGWLDALGIKVFTHHNVVGLVTLSFLVTFATVSYRGIDLLGAVKEKVKAQPAPGAERLFRAVVGLLSAALVLSVLVNVAYSPVSAWDALGFWTTWAKHFLVFDSTSWVVDGASRALGDSYPDVHDRHPMTLIYVAAFNAFVTETLLSTKGWLLPWTYVWFCGLSCTVGIVKLSSRTWTPTVVAAYLYLSLPLLENHAILVGYAEPWVASCVVASAAVIAAGIAHSSNSLVALGVSVAATPLLLKNTGILYFAALIAPLAYNFLRARWRKIHTFLFFTLTTLLAYFLQQGFLIEVMGTRYGIVHDKSSVIFFGGWVFELQIFPLSKVAFNQFVALFVNQTFSVVFLYMCLASAIFFRGRASNSQCSDLMAARYLILVVVALLVVFLIPQLITDYSNLYAVPHADTGNSRFLLAAGSLLVLTIGFILNPKTRNALHAEPAVGDAQ